MLKTFATSEQPVATSSLTTSSTSSKRLALQAIGAAPSAVIVSGGATIVSESCTLNNGVLDPNETVTVSFCVVNTGSANTANLVGTLQATGGVTSPSGPQNYGVAVAGGPPVCRNFTFTVNGTCGGTVTATLDLEDTGGGTRPAGASLGSVTYTFTLGTPVTAFTQNFDGVVAPNLPAGWSATQGVNAGGFPAWVTSNAGTPAPPADTAPNAIFSPDPNNLLDNRIDTPSIAITTATAQLTFKNNFNLESTFDGGVLEIAIGAGAFTDIITAGGSFVAGGYNGIIDTDFASPIAGRNAWTGNSAGFVTTTVNLPAAANGGTVVLRFRRATDSSVSGQGIRIDTLTSTGTSCGGAVCNSITCPANITQSNDPNQCGAIVNYPAPTTSGTCAVPTCTPASGTFFDVGTTTVTCTTTGPPQRQCSFTVTVVDTQPPTITCPGPQTAVAPASCPIATAAVGTFPPPVASDNCPGVTVACVPPSGSPFPVGTTTVTCTATDAAGNTATCSFAVTAFNVCLQDDNNPGNRLLINTFTGQYRFFCANTPTPFTGVGKMGGNRPGSCLFSLRHTTPAVRVEADFSTNTKTGNASIQSPPGTERCGIQDRDLSNNNCGGGGPPTSSKQ